MSDQIEQKIPPEQHIPSQCAQCPFLDKEVDLLPEVATIHLYCRAPWWHPKHWSCTLPPEVVRA